MLAWLKRFFNPVCPECVRLHAILAEREARHKAVIELLETRIKMCNENQAYRDELSRNIIKSMEADKATFQEALFRVARISAPKVVHRETPSGGGDTPEPIGSNRNWSDVRRTLERAHRKSNPDAEAKLKQWSEINAKAEREIPELAKAIHPVDLQQDIQELESGT